LADVVIDDIEILLKDGKGNPLLLQSMIDAIKKGEELFDADQKYIKNLIYKKSPPKGKTINELKKSVGYSPDDEREINNILDQLDFDEKVLLVAKQSRLRPGGALTSPNTVFATDRRLIIRNPTMLGMRENIEDIPYDQITSVKIERGMFSSTILIRSPGLSELSRLSDSLLAWGRGEDGSIDSLDTDKAEELLLIIKKGMAEARKRKEQPTANVNKQFSVADELTKLANLKDQGVISEEEFTKMKNDLIN